MESCHTGRPNKQKQEGLVYIKLALCRMTSFKFILIFTTSFIILDLIEFSSLEQEPSTRILVQPPQLTNPNKTKQPFKMCNPYKNDEPCILQENSKRGYKWHLRVNMLKALAFVPCEDVLDAFVDLSEAFNWGQF